MSPSDADPARRERALALLTLVLALAVALVHGLTVRPGHSWWGMDDFTAYVLHGRNLLEGRPYDAIDPVVDPRLPPSYQRKAFPPAFPLVVGLVERLFPPAPDELPLAAGLSSTWDFPALPALKRLVVLCFAGALLAVFMAFRRAAPPRVLVPTLLVLASCPYLFAFRELVRSETLFLLLLFAWFAVLEQEARGALPAVAAGLLLFLCYATRTAAVVMVPTVLLWDLARVRRVRRVTWIGLAVAGLCVFAQSRAFAYVEQGYAAKAAREFGLGTLVENAQQLRWNLMRFWDTGSGPLTLLLALGTSALAAVGFLVRVRRPASFDVFAVLYGVLILLLPTDSAWLRYLIPLLPMLFLYLFTGVAWVARRDWTAAGQRRQRLALGGAALVVLCSWGGAYGRMSFGPLRDGLLAPTTQEVFAWVVQHTAPSDVVVFSKNRALTLATGRPALCYPREFAYGPLPDEEVWRHLTDVGARVLVLKHSPPASAGLYHMLSHSDAEFLDGFLARNAERFRERLRNEDFTILERWDGGGPP